jgi:ankyrin repeat protein
MSIHEAVLTGNAAAIRAAMDREEGSLNDMRPAAGFSGVTAMHLVTRMGQKGTMTDLFGKGADLEVADLDHGATPLGWAAFNGDAGMARHLIALGANLNPDYKPLDIALYGRNGDWKTFTDTSPEEYQIVIDLLVAHGGVSDGLEDG